MAKLTGNETNDDDYVREHFRLIDKIHKDTSKLPRKELILLLTSWTHNDTLKSVFEERED
jgi:hypothetical protein